jgi:hypothetical protein
MFPSSSISTSNAGTTASSTNSPSSSYAKIATVAVASSSAL